MSTLWEYTGTLLKRLAICLKSRSLEPWLKFTTSQTAVDHLSIREVPRFFGHECSESRTFFYTDLKYMTLMVLAIGLDGGRHPLSV